MKTIPQILQDSKTIAVVGLSSNPDRPSYGVSQYMQAHGYRIVPINPAYVGQRILGAPVYATLADAAAALAVDGVHIDIVNCFRKSEDILPFAHDAIAIGAHCLWLQQGIVNQYAAELAGAAGLLVVMDACIKIDHRNLAAA